ncbi:MAG: NAD(P)H-hydrate epimerase [bacterium]|nr:NAD(P)H-hydrate epimerase [bacterium]
MNYPAVLSSEQMNYQDRLTIESSGVPGSHLMELAANAVRMNFQSNINPSDKIAVICGTGNNGGDGYAVARQLHIQGFKVECFQTDHPKTLDALHHMKIMNMSGLKSNHIKNFVPERFEWVIDALLGTGLKQAIRENLQTVVNKINTIANIISIDIPSGICSDTGNGWHCHVIADRTVTFQFAKRGHYLAQGIRATGELEIADIGITPIVDKNSCWYRRAPKKPAAPPRLNDQYSHKGLQGKVVVAGAAPGTIGAGLFCAQAARNVGSGLVSILAPELSVPILQSKAPDIMSFSFNRKFDAETLIVGPGCSQDSHIQKQLKQLIKNHSNSLILDAEGLRMFNDWIELEEHLQPNTDPRQCILTPHPGELKILIKLYQQSKSGGFEQMLHALKIKGVTLLAKDAYTVVYGCNHNPVILGQPNVQLARGGSGDILAGMIGSFLAKGLAENEAICLAFDWLNHAASTDNLISVQTQIPQCNPTELLLKSLNNLRLRLSTT